MRKRRARAGGRAVWGGRHAGGGPRESRPCCGGRHRALPKHGDAPPAGRGARGACPPRARGCRRTARGRPSCGPRCTPRAGGSPGGGAGVGWGRRRAALVEGRAQAAARVGLGSTRARGATCTGPDTPPPPTPHHLDVDVVVAAPEDADGGEPRDEVVAAHLLLLRSNHWSNAGQTRVRHGVKRGEKGRGSAARAGTQRLPARRAPQKHAAAAAARAAVAVGRRRRRPAAPAAHLRAVDLGVADAAVAALGVLLVHRLGGGLPRRLQPLAPVAPGRMAGAGRGRGIGASAAGGRRLQTHTRLPYEQLCGLNRVWYLFSTVILARVLTRV
jgi:hypothetical protein